jgi:hypothetical protein
MRLSAVACLLVSLVAAVACASTGQTEIADEQSGVSSMNIDVGGMSSAYDLRYVEDLTPVVDTVDAPLDPVWNALPDAYVRLGVPLREVNPEAHLLGNDGFRVRGELGGERISRYIHCGRTMTGDIADQYDIYMTILTQVQAVEGTDRTRVVSLVDARAQPTSRSGNALRCTSSQRLEDAILGAIGLAMAGSGMDGGA